jgi:hypothetical protein
LSAAALTRPNADRYRWNTCALHAIHKREMKISVLFREDAITCTGAEVKGAYRHPLGVPACRDDEMRKDSGRFSDRVATSLACIRGSMRNAAPAVFGRPYGGQRGQPCMSPLTKPPRFMPERVGPGTARGPAESSKGGSKRCVDAAIDPASRPGSRSRPSLRRKSRGRVWPNPSVAAAISREPSEMQTSSPGPRRINKVLVSWLPRATAEAAG